VKVKNVTLAWVKIYGWSPIKPYHSIASNFHHHFLMKVWCVVINNHLIGVVDLEECLITAFPTGQATTSLEGISVQARLSLWLQHDGAASNFGLQVTQFLEGYRKQHMLF
jgi:hypothetical protein